MLKGEDLVYLAKCEFRKRRIFDLVHNVVRNNPTVNTLTRHSVVQLYLGDLEISGRRIRIVEDANITLHGGPMHKSLLKRIHIAVVALNDLIYSASAILI